MEEILQNARSEKHIRTISIMVVSSSFYCNKLHEALQKVHMCKDNNYKLTVVAATCISDILEFNNKVPVDFIVFVVDTSNSIFLEQVQKDLNFLDRQFYIGRICIVNATNFLTNTVMHDLVSLAENYRIPIINGDIRKENKSEIVAERIITLMNANLLNEIPFVPWVVKKSY